jgi:chromosome segregation ATPase
MDEDLKSYFNQQFSSMRQQLEQRLEQRFEVVDRRFESMDQRLEAMEQRFDGKIEQLRQEMNQQFKEVKTDAQQLQSDIRQAYVLIEDIHGQVRLVADGVANCNEQLQRHRDEVAGKLEDQEELDLRVRRLESAAGLPLPPTGSLRRSRSR